MNITSPHGRVSALPTPVLSFASGTTVFDVVIVTRNRPEALRQSLPPLIAQSQRPQRIVVIDSSDDPDPVQQIVAQQAMPIAYEHTARGSGYQRNFGLQHVTAPVVFLPADTTLCRPCTAEAMMHLYSRDPDHRIAGVCAGVRPSSNAPFAALARILGRAHAPPDWLAQEDAAPVPWMPAAAMSFRTDAIVDDGFEEAFRSHGIHEDVDASFKALRHGVLVAANRARVSCALPGRIDPFNNALMSMLNCAFVMARHSAALPEAQAMRRRTKAFAMAQAARLVPKLGRRNARAKFRGTRGAIRVIDQLFDAADLDRTYAGLRDHLLR